MDEETYSYDIFVSYRWVTPDQEWVREQLYPALVNAGLKVCLDVEDFVPGRDLILEMERAGLESRHVVCVVSPEYFEEGRMVEFESLSARRRDPSGRNSFLIPLVLRETKIPERIQGLIPVDWTNTENHAREWKKLLRVLGATNLDASFPGVHQPGTIRPLVATGDASRTSRSTGVTPVVADSEALAELSSFRCTSPLCRSQDLDLTDAVEISSLSADAEGWTVHGIVHMNYCVHGRCRTCGRVFEAATRQIPVQFPELACNECGQRALLQYRVQALERVNNGFEFSVDIRCSGCRGKKTLTRLLTGLFGTVGIEIGIAGISIKRSTQVSGLSSG